MSCTSYELRGNTRLPDLYCTLAFASPNLEITNQSKCSPSVQKWGFWHYIFKCAMNRASDTVLERPQSIVCHSLFSIALYVTSLGKRTYSVMRLERHFLACLALHARASMFESVRLTANSVCRAITLFYPMCGCNKLCNVSIITRSAGLT